MSISVIVIIELSVADIDIDISAILPYLEPCKRDLGHRITSVGCAGYVRSCHAVLFFSVVVRIKIVVDRAVVLNHAGLVFCDKPEVSEVPEIYRSGGEVSRCRSEAFRHLCIGYPGSGIALVLLDLEAQEDVLLRSSLRYVGSVEVINAVITVSKSTIVVSRDDCQSGDFIRSG